jgi:hypothetical protein
VNRLQHRQPRACHAKISRTQLIRVIGCGSHGTNIVPFLESVKSFGGSISGGPDRRKNRVDLMPPAAKLLAAVCRQHQ